MQEYKGNINELKDWLSHTEGRYYERKAAEISKLKVANTLISFANQDGGTIAIGIKNRQFQGINHLSPHRITDFEKKVVIYTYEYEKLKPKYFIKTTTDIKDSTVRNILKKLVSKKVLRRIGTSKTDPNAYYELDLN